MYRLSDKKPPENDVAVTIPVNLASPTTSRAEDGSVDPIPTFFVVLIPTALLAQVPPAPTPPPPLTAEPFTVNEPTTLTPVLFASSLVLPLVSKVIVSFEGNLIEVFVSPA